jgi:hypothetical protein
MVAIGEDLRYPETRGGKVDIADRLIRRYLDRVVAAAAVDRWSTRRSSTWWRCWRSRRP